MSETTETAESGETSERPKPKPITLQEIIEECENHACDLETTQKALVAAGLRIEPYAPAIRQAVVFDKIAQVFRDLRKVEPAFRALLEKARKS